MCQIGTEGAVGPRPRDGVAVDARGGLEDAPTLRHRVDLRDGLLLTDEPALEVFLRFDDDSQQHLGVLRPAILRALPYIHADIVWIDPRAVRPIRNQIRLAGQLR